MWFHSSLPSNTFCTCASVAKIGSCKLEKGYCYLIDNYQSKLKVNTKTDCRKYVSTIKKKEKKETGPDLPWSDCVRQNNLEIPSVHLNSYQNANI